VPGYGVRGSGSHCDAPAAARAALVRPELVPTRQLSATTQPDEHEHQADEARCAIAPEAVKMSDPVLVKVRGLPPHPPWDDGAEPEPVKSAFGVLRSGCAAS
jgi:hypothetical protein